MSTNGMIELTVNGNPVRPRRARRSTRWSAQQGLDSIPTLCHAPDLKPYGSCFVCVVEVEGRPNLVPSCATVVAPGMKVTTNNERITASRKTALELLMSNHYADCLAPCVLGCPAHVDVQGYIALAARGEYGAAADLIRQTNPLPAVCGRVCVRKCEAVCRRKLLDDAVAINDLKRYITDSPQAYDSWPQRADCDRQARRHCRRRPGRPDRGVLPGPARPRAARCYEMMPEPGGMLRYGIPSYRLPREVLAQEIDYICTRSGSHDPVQPETGPRLQPGGSARAVRRGVPGHGRHRAATTWASRGKKTPPACSRDWTF